MRGRLNACHALTVYSGEFISALTYIFGFHCCYHNACLHFLKQSGLLSWGFKVEKPDIGMHSDIVLPGEIFQCYRRY